MQGKTAQGLLASLALLAGCATTAPSEEGARLYGEGAYEEAWRSLVPVASKGDPDAKYYIGLMGLSGDAPAPQDPAASVRAIADAAKLGHHPAYGLLLLLSMSADERAAFAAASAEWTLRRIPSQTSYAELQQLSMLSAAPIPAAQALAERKAAGPIPIGSLLAMADLAETMDSWPGRPLAARPQDSDLLAVDETLANQGDKYAQARLGNRYAEGRSVAADLEAAFKWRVRAAKASGAPRNCVYQAPVGGGSGSTYCYDSGTATAGLSSAQLEVCRSYATGVGAQKDPRQARLWCERAAKSASLRAEAEAILAGL